MLICYILSNNLQSDLEIHAQINDSSLTLFMDSWSCLSPDTQFRAGIHERAHQPFHISECVVTEMHCYSLFVLFLSLKGAILQMGQQEAWPIPCCDWRAWDLSDLKPEQRNENVQTSTQQNEPCVTQECWVSHRAGEGILKLWWMWGKSLHLAVLV